MENIKKYRRDLHLLWLDSSVTGTVNGFRYAIHRNPLGHLCGYVEMRGSRQDAEEIVCHGGITYDVDSPKHHFGLSGHFIGFDCGHAGDWIPTLLDGTYKDIGFVFSEIVYIVKQLEEVNGTQ